MRVPRTDVLAKYVNPPLLRQVFMKRSAALAAALAVLFCFGYAALHAAAAITLLHEFAGGADDGAEPYARLTLSGSTLFGTTLDGGDAGSGTVFSMNTDGSGFTLLHEFAGGANNGSGPYAGLTQSGSTLFGTTFAGGGNGLGTVFSINADGSGFTLLHEFAGGQNDGWEPIAGVAIGGSTLFGTTIFGGDNDEGTLYSINSDGSGYRLLREFAGGANDGADPGGLTLSGSTLFGTTWAGGDHGGTIFSINTDGSGFTLLHEFGGANDGCCPHPLSVLTQSGSTLFGTTYAGGDDYFGTVYSINTDGSGFTLLHEFAGGADDGHSPRAGLTLSGSTLYGTTMAGGDNDGGTVFSINTDGSNFTLLHEFAGGVNDGERPQAGLTLSGSRLFGTTEIGGDNDLGTVFSIEIPDVDLEGDYNDDNSVDAADYVVWRKNVSQSYETWRSLFGQSGPNPPGDFNNDHNVDTADYVVWRKTMHADYNTWTTNFAEPSGRAVGSAAASSSSTSAPEPASLLLFLSGLVMCILCTRSERQE